MKRTYALFVLFSTVLSLLLTRTAGANEKVTLKENRHPGDTIQFEYWDEVHDPSAVLQTSSSVATRILKGTVTVVAVKEGSSIESRVDVDPASADAVKNQGDGAQNKPSPLAGSVVTLNRKSDGTIGASKDAGDDADMITGLLWPDQNFFPDHPVEVGDVWDVSKAFAEENHIGIKDKLTAKCRLDSLKVVDGRRLAAVTCSLAQITHAPDDSESDVEQTVTVTVDVAKGLIISADGTARTTNLDPTKKMTGQSDWTVRSHCTLIESPTK